MDSVHWWAESEISLDSRTFRAQGEWSSAKRCWTNRQKMQRQDSNTHFLIWKNVYVFNIASICIHGEELLRQFTFHSKIQGTISQLQQMFDISHIWKVDNRTIRWDFWSVSKSTWKILYGNNYLRSVMKKSSVSSHAKVYAFSHSVLCLGKMNREPTIKYCLGRHDWRGSRVSSQYRTYFGHNWRCSQWNLSGLFSQDSPHYTSATKSKSSCQKWARSQKNFTGRIIFMSMFNDISWWSKDNEQECEVSAKLVSVYARRFSPGRWSFLGPW